MLCLPEASWVSWQLLKSSDTCFITLPIAFWCLLTRSDFYVVGFFTRLPQHLNNNTQTNHTLRLWEAQADYEISSVKQHCQTFTKPPRLQESRLTGGGSPNLVVLVEWKVPVERFMGAVNRYNWFHPWLYTCTGQKADRNWFYMPLLQLYSVPGFPLYEDTDLRRATAHQFYCFAIEVLFGANAVSW